MILGKTSMGRLVTCRPELQLCVLDAALSYRVGGDFGVVSGRRNREEQEDAFRRGASIFRYPDSLHNREPLSFAVDLAPYRLNNYDWNDVDEFWELGARMFQAAVRCGVEIRWGGLWHKPDLPHFQLSKVSNDEPSQEVLRQLETMRSRAAAAGFAPVPPGH